MSGREQSSRNTKRSFPQFDAPATIPHRSRQPPAFRSDFDPPRPKQRARTALPLASLAPDRHTRPRPSAPVNNDNATAAAPVGVLAPPPIHLPVMKSTKIIEPPKIRPSTPPRSLATPNLTSFLSPPRPSKPTHIARATDVLTEAELLGLTLARDLR
ncbi:hypothetical protein EI94DRAFT_1761006 [Lactarius quietus]|nr:hypothetical protein EI94DRAFT_1761006 [Lactarius quietus]